MLTIFRRHLKSCGKKSRRYRRCQCPIQVEGTLAGESVRRSLDLTSWEAAENLIHEWNRAGKIGVVDRGITVRDAVEEFLADAQARQLRPETVRLQRTLLTHFSSWCEANGYAELVKLDVDALREYRTTWKFSAITAVKKLERLRSFFRFCESAGWVNSNPALAVAAPKVTQPPTLPFSHEEVTAMLAACEKFPNKGLYGTANKVRMRAFILVLRYSGLRISDAVTLDTSRVDESRIFLYMAKTGQPVWVPIPPIVKSALDEVPLIGGRFYFWTGESRVKTARGSWDRALRKIFRLAKVERGDAHRFRDSFATSLLLAGVPMEDVSILLGHKSIRVTEKHYSPFVKARQERLEERVRPTWPDEKPKLKVIQGGA